LANTSHQNLVHLKSMTDIYEEGKRQSCPCALTKHHAMKAYWGSGGIAPGIIDLGTRWMWVVSFTPQPLYS
jgi:hypothetical protein